MFYVTEIIFEDGTEDGCGAGSLEAAITVLNHDIEENQHTIIKSAQIFKVIDNKRTLVVSMRTVR